MNTVGLLTFSRTQRSRESSTSSRPDTIEISERAMKTLGQLAHRVDSFNIRRQNCRGRFQRPVPIICVSKAICAGHLTQRRCCCRNLSKETAWNESGRLMAYDAASVASRSSNAQDLNKHTLVSLRCYKYRRWLPHSHCLRHPT